MGNESIFIDTYLRWLEYDNVNPEYMIYLPTSLSYDIFCVHITVYSKVLFTYIVYHGEEMWHKVQNLIIALSHCYCIKLSTVPQSTRAYWVTGEGSWSLSWPIYNSLSLKISKYHHNKNAALLNIIIFLLLFK